MTTGVGSWEGNLTVWEGGKVMPGGRLTYSGTWNALTYILGLSSGTTVNRRHTADVYLRPGTAPFGRQDQS